MNTRHGKSFPRPTAQRKTGRSSRERPARPEQHFAQAIRRLRESRRLSVRTLAGKCGFSASFISQVELGQASPSIASLERIASGLGITLGQFFQTTEPAAPALIRASRRPVLHSGWSRAKIESLGPPGPGSKLEALFITLRPGGSSGARLHTRETELFALVFTGEVLLQFAATVQALRRGDAVTIPAGTLHRWANTTAKRVQLLEVVPRLVP